MEPPPPPSSPSTTSLALLPSPLGTPPTNLFPIGNCDFNKKKRGGQIPANDYGRCAKGAGEMGGGGGGRG